MAGIDEVTPHIELDGSDEVVAAFKEIASAAEQAFSQIEAAASKVGGAGEHVKKAAEEGKEALKELGIIGAEAFGKILDAAAQGNLVPAVTAMFGRLAGVLGEVTEKAISFVEAQASMVETLSNLASATGMTLSQIEGLKDAFASVGISTNGFERAIGRLAITISNEWAQIQQSVRTSADEQTGAMLHVQETAYGVTKAYNTLYEALDHSSRSAAQNALGIESAALSLRSAMQALSDFALTSRANTLGVESATLALERAKMNLAKDRGYAVDPAAEKRLKIAQDENQVKEAELRLSEASNKKVKEGLEMEELQLRVKKAKQEASDAEHKQLEESVKAAQAIKDAHLGVDKAQLANRESHEKQHEMDLKNIPQIAREIDNVANGYKKWDEVMNHAEISAQNLTKAVILAASNGDMSKQPTSLSVFEKMVEIFPKITDEGQKLALVQHTMGAGFRAGQASAAQMIAVMNRFGENTQGAKQALHQLFEETEKFSHVKIAGFDLDKSVQALKDFNSAAAQMDAAVDQIKNRLAAIISVPLTEFFTRIKESIYDTNGFLNRASKALGEFLEVIMTIVKAAGDAIRGFAMAINSVATGISTLTGMRPEVVFEGMATAAVILVPILNRIAQAIIFIVARFALLGAGIGAAIQAFGVLYAAFDYVFGKSKDFEKSMDNALVKAGKLITQSSLSALGIDARNTTFGLNDKQSKEMGMVTQKEEAAADKLTGGADKLTSGADKLTGAGEKHTEAAGSLQAAGQTMAQNLGGAGDKLQTAAASLNDAAAAIKTAASSMGGKTGSAATGGLIRGPGGPTDDKAGLYALSDGEYVVRSQAVAHYGPQLFSALNNLALGGFATGGMVGGPRAPSVPGGATGGPTSVLNLTIDGQHFNGLRAPEHVASKLKTYAVGRQSSSAGRMPTWMK